jgi:hypothetical protein
VVAPVLVAAEPARAAREACGRRPKRSGVCAAGRAAGARVHGRRARHGLRYSSSTRRHARCSADRSESLICGGSPSPFGASGSVTPEGEPPGGSAPMRCAAIPCPCRISLRNGATFDLRAPSSAERRAGASARARQPRTSRRPSSRPSRRWAAGECRRAHAWASP